MKQTISAASSHATEQYAKTSSNLDARLAILEYDTAPQRWHVWLGDRLPVKGKVLECGAGTGELWKHVDHSEAKLTLTDFSSAMCDRLREMKIPGAEVRQCDASKLPFADATFDTVIANHMLYHLDDPSKALSEFARVLKPGGRVCTALNGKDHIAELLQLGADIGRPSKIVHASKIFAGTAPELLEEFFIDVRSEKFPGEFDCPTAKPVIDYLGSWDEQELSSSQKAKAKEIIDRRIQQEDSFRIRKEMFLLTGTKR